MYISEFSQMEEFIARVRAEKAVAVDTEFLREKTFYPRLCLIQIGTAKETAAIDPLLIEDLTPVKELLTDESVVKIFHAAYYCACFNSHCGYCFYNHALW